MPDSVKYLLPEDRIPRAWYNIAADLPSPPPPRASSRHRQAARAGRPRAALPDGADRAGGLGRARDRDSRAGARNLQAVAPGAALPRPPAREGARYAGAHLLQVRGRQPARQPQAEHRRAAGLLQPRSRRPEALDRDRRRPMGLVAGLRRATVRHRSQGLHGQGQLPAEALSPGADGDLRRDLHREPEQRDRLRPRRPRQGSRTPRAASASPSPRRSRSPPRTPTPTTRSAACSTTC